MSIPKALLFAVVLASASDTPKAAAAGDDAKKLQGTWRVTKFVDQGEVSAPAEEIKDFTFEFRGDRVTVRKAKDDPGRQMKYTLNPAKDPKGIEIAQGERAGVSEGIYKLAGDTLTLCVVGGKRGGKVAPRPAEFKASKRDKYSLFVLEKVKK
jgi:uncharacterized protein (TIGR03067 family)